MTLTRMPMPLQLAVGQQRNGAKPVTKRRYDRAAAVTYAKTFVKRHCSDGYVAVRMKATAPYREVQPGHPFNFLDENRQKTENERTTDLRGQPVPFSILNDCTHYTSCCIGRPYDALRLSPMLARKPDLSRANAPRLPGGGLNVPTLEGHGAPWLYGIVGAPVLADYLSRPRVGIVTAKRLFEVARRRWAQNRPHQLVLPCHHEQARLARQGLHRHCDSFHRPSAVQRLRATASLAIERASRSFASWTRHAPARTSAWARAAASTCTPRSPSHRATELSLERLCRHVCRPPIAQERLKYTANGKLIDSLKKAWRDGTVALVIEPLDLLARVCALIPPPRPAIPFGQS